MAFRSPSLSDLFHHLHSIMDILFTKIKSLNEGLHRGSSFAVFALISSLSIVYDKKCIQISLDFFKRGIHLFSEEYRIELIKKRLVEPFSYPIRLGMSSLGLRMLNIAEI